MSLKDHKRLRVGITIGDLNGIGPEIILKTLFDKRVYEILTPVVYASAKSISFYKKAFGFGEIHFNIIKNTDEIIEKTPNLINCWDEEVKINPGEASTESGKYAFLSLKQAVEDLAGNKIDVLVTAPIDKSTIQSKDFHFPGHTEYLANYANEDHYLMMMISDFMKLAIVTSHVPLKEVASQLTTELILSKIQTLNKTLIQDFGIEKPKIAVLGLNPHAGDKGLLGQEENTIIIPAINKAKEQNMLVFGPYGADGFFGSPNFKKFDAILAMYHDQGLIPFKAMCFDSGVNYTAGLPIVRTSPDHGVGYEIAGQNIADENSFRTAIYAACDIYKTRKMYRALTENQLKTSQLPKEFMS